MWNPSIYQGDARWGQGNTQKGRCQLAWNTLERTCNSHLQKARIRGPNIYQRHIAYLHGGAHKPTLLEAHVPYTCVMHIYQ